MHNWYKLAKLEQHLRAEAGFKQDLTKILSTSVLSALMLIFEVGAINRKTIDEVAKKSNLNDQEKRQLEQIVQNPALMNKTQEFLYPQQNQENPTSPQQSTQVSTASIINVGKELIDRGFKVGYHPNFSYTEGFDEEGKQRVGGHSKNSYHYRNQAFDISGASSESMKTLFDELYSKRSELGLTELIYDHRGHWFSKTDKLSYKPFGGHGNHIHVAFNTPGIIKEYQENEVARL